MKVICDQHDSCNNFECDHIEEHSHFHMCDEKCSDDGHVGAKCYSIIKEIRKQKLKKLNDSIRKL